MGPCFRRDDDGGATFQASPPSLRAQRSNPFFFLRALSFRTRTPRTSFSTSAGGYGSLLSQGRRWRSNIPGISAVIASAAKQSILLSSCPIVSNAHSENFLLNKRRWLWVPAFAGTTMEEQHSRHLRRHCERSEAIHSSFFAPRDGLLRFASLAMTVLWFWIRLRPRGAKRPRRCLYLPP